MSQMNDKTTLMRAFNNHFFDFLDDIVRIVPENEDLAVSLNSFSMIRKGNPVAIIKAWWKFIYSQYKDVIDSGDISFFFEKDYADDLSHLKNSENIMKIIDTLRKPISGMSEANRAHSMKYIQNLSKLSMLYSEA